MTLPRNIEFYPENVITETCNSRLRTEIGQEIVQLPIDLCRYLNVQTETSVVNRNRC
jgi:hypothetical protein